MGGWKRAARAGDGHQADDGGGAGDDREGASTVTRTVTANAQGRLVVSSFTVGPANTQPDYTNGAQPWSTATPNPYRTTTVTIT